MTDADYIQYYRHLADSDETLYDIESPRNSSNSNRSSHSRRMILRTHLSFPQHSSPLLQSSDCDNNHAENNGNPNINSSQNNEKHYNNLSDNDHFKNDAYQSDNQLEIDQNDNQYENKKENCQNGNNDIHNECASDWISSRIVAAEEAEESRRTDITSILYPTQAMEYRNRLSRHYDDNEYVVDDSENDHAYLMDSTYDEDVEQDDTDDTLGLDTLEVSTLGIEDTIGIVDTIGVVDTIDMIQEGYNQSTSVVDEIDVSYGRIRPSRRSTSQSSSELVEFAQVQRDLIRSEILFLRERHERTLRGLLLIRLEQFRLRHQQLLSLLEFMQNHDHIGSEEPSTILELREFFVGVTVDMLRTMRQLVNTTDNVGSDLDVDSLDSLMDQVRRHGPSFEGPLLQGATDAEIVGQLSERHFSSELDGSCVCTICMCDFVEGNEQAAMSCEHWHCKSCLEQWLKVNNSCPVCRHPLGSETNQGEELRLDSVGLGA